MNEDGVQSESHSSLSTNYNSKSNAVKNPNEINMLPSIAEQRNERKYN